MNQLGQSIFTCFAGVPNAVTDDAEAILAELSEHLKVGEHRFLLRKSADPTLVSVVQLLGDVAAWLPLSAAATVYFSALAKRAADATWTGLASLFNAYEAKPLVDVATTLARQRRSA